MFFQVCCGPYKWKLDGVKLICNDVLENWCVNMIFQQMTLIFKMSFLSCKTIIMMYNPLRNMKKTKTKTERYCM